MSDRENVSDTIQNFNIALKASAFFKDLPSKQFLFFSWLLQTHEHLYDAWWGELQCSMNMPLVTSNKLMSEVQSWLVCNFIAVIISEEGEVVWIVTGDISFYHCSIICYKRVLLSGGNMFELVFAVLAGAGWCLPGGHNTTQDSIEQDQLSSEQCQELK